MNQNQSGRSVLWVQATQSDQLNPSVLRNQPVLSVQATLRGPWGLLRLSGQWHLSRRSEPT